MRVLAGAVCGRFQPLHREHMEYIEGARSRSESLTIGLVVPPSQSVGTPQHRLASTSNPLSVGERIQMMRVALAPVCGLEKLDFVSFSLERGDTISHSTTMFVTMCDSWSVQKIDMLKKYYPVVVIERSAPPSISSSEIRRKIQAGDSSWRLSVPREVAMYLDRIEFERRLLELAAEP